MYGLPENFDVKMFFGKKIELICFSENTISLSFEENISITIMGSFVYKGSHDEIGEVQTPPASSSGLTSLINQPVRNAEIIDKSNLVFYFENGQSVHILNDCKEYESYIIKINEDEIIV